MKIEINGKTLTIYLDGHISSVNADAVNDEIVHLLKKHTPEELIFDAAELKYISSAGLRVILKLRQRYEGIKVVNVSSEVYEIFDITGFTELFTVEKAYRRYDVSNCEVIGEGANGMVYRVNGDTIVKVYKDADALDDIKRERELSRTAFLLGIPTAISFDVVRVDDTYGVVFELLNAKSYIELMREDEGNLEFCVSESIRILKMIHSTKAPRSLPLQSEYALKWVETVKRQFSDEQYYKLKNLLEDLPEVGYLLHGDYHFKNIMFNNNETLLIDMDTLCSGHPIYELSFMFNAYVGFGLTDKSWIEDFFGISIDLAYRIWRRSLELYFDTEDQAYLDKIEEKASVIAYVRLMRRVISRGYDDLPEGRKLVDACRGRIADLLTRVDSLTF